MNTFIQSRASERGFFMGVKRKQACAHENHEQGIIVSSRLFMQRMRMMPVLLSRHCKPA